jgi:cytoskeletal protein CcmA (bactofilin family)
VTRFAPPAPAGAAPPQGAPAAAAGTTIAKGMTWRGDLVAAEDVRVAGLLEGTIESTGEVTVERSGLVRGSITGARVRIAGEVEGNVAAARLIRVEGTGRVLGDLEARSVSVADGALVGGQIRTLESAGARGDA